MYDKLYNEAEKYYMMEEYKKALELFSESYKLKADDDCLNYIGCCYLAMELYTSASEVFKKLIKRSPDFARPVFNLGRVYVKQNRLQDALKCFEKAILINPSSEDGYFYIGLYYERVEDFKQASIFYEKSISLDFEQAETHLNLGICYAKMNMYEKAIEEFDISYSQDDFSKDALFNKAMLFVIMGDYIRAIEIFLYINEVEPDNIDNMIDIADSYLRINDLDNASKWANKILLKDPSNKMVNKLLKLLWVLKREKQI
ncbi:tetratricopeptide repeat protein [Inconstantimicrobium mannanitabidum]|uniref:Uncharacterized protein n=1 Tax=Inconstantimicrobium mannanitabidum TaxID=1604901 RepID=A0ACB5RHN3_9CLOT|nr:tetratricopeptide repeat protein [Clostridium sp. TW13]GKX68621.1 hypothetical protein rsdtw13_38790 [Clostridium sp. TW13]